MQNRILDRLKLTGFLIELDRFHGQEVYVDLGPSIARKKPYFRFIFALIRLTYRSRGMNFLFLTGVLLCYRIFRYPSPANRVFQYGVSRNNVIAFERLNRCLAAHGVNDVSMNDRTISFSVRLKTALSIQSVWWVAETLTESRHRRPLAHVQALIGCATLLLYSAHPLPETVKIVCVASDHSPVCQALLFLARLEGRRTCYIQHAPVTDHFPPLTHDLAILYDRASANSYERAAKRHGLVGRSKIVLFSPFERAFCRPQLRAGSHVVGICLSFLPRLEVIRTILTSLSDSPYVSRIVLRSHPRCQLNLSDIFAIKKVVHQPKGQSVSEFFEAVDLVLVPNSGVTIEALRSGRPTFFTPGADYLPNDYYGFVADRIVPVFQNSDLGNPCQLMAFFDEDWLERFGVYDETVNNTHLAACTRVGLSFLELLV